MKYQKGSCSEVSGELCWHCKWNDWIGSKCNRIVQPIPDPKNPMHYLDVFSTPLVNGKGRNREADDWQPRVHITSAFNEGLVSLDNREGISELCKELACEEKQIVATLEHIKDIEIRKENRARERQETRTAQKEKSFADYDWLSLTMKGNLHSLKVYGLDKYFSYHGLIKKGRKRTR